MFPHPVTRAEFNRKKICFVLFVFFLARTQSMLSHRYCLLQLAHFPFYKRFFFPCHAGTCTWLQTLNCNSLLIQNKPIFFFFFTGEISSSLVISCQHYICEVAQSCLTLCDPHGVTKKLLQAPPGSSIHGIF